MALIDPVKVYTAASNLEAELLTQLLGDEGIEAHAVLDDSRASVWVFGTLPQIHKPTVWVEKTNKQRARAILEEYERKQQAANELKKAGETSLDRSISVICEDCQRQSFFAQELLGTIQDCPYCGAYVDVGDPEADWSPG